MRLRTAAITDVGRMRPRNEDRLVCSEEQGLYGVADGVGGLPHGAEAAELALRVIAANVAMARPQELDDLRPLTLTANEQVNLLGQRLAPDHGIGTTLTYGVLVGRSLLVAHVGDSRCCRVRSGRLETITMDHTVENEVRASLARGEPMDFHEHFRHALTRCVGQPTPPEVDLHSLPLSAGDLILFLSDGLCRVLSDAELVRELTTTEGTLNDALSALVRQANARGGPDNLTAVVLAVDEL